MLTIVPTPIGNLKDITLRAIETLQNVDGIICEDTRRVSILLNHFSITGKPLFVLNDFNEAKQFPNIMQKLEAGEHLALVSDAGTPLISDPGYKLVREALNNNLAVDSLPGASAVITALTLSSLAPDKFMFLGFLPEKQGKRIDLFKKIRQTHELIPTTYVAFISPYKVTKDLDDIIAVYGDIEITLAKELTKIHQSVQTKKVSFFIEQFKKTPPRGEWVLLFRPN